MSSIAEVRLKELFSGILHNTSSPKTLAYFRLSNPDIVKTLEEFAASSNDNHGGEAATRPLLDQVLDLFQRLNHHMAAQEQSCPTWGDFFVASKAKDTEAMPSTTKNISSPLPSSPSQISVVFGGKYSKNPASISEQLVWKLVPRSKTVYTVSRSSCRDADLPNNVKHIPKQNLDAYLEGETATKGADEFYDVMAMAKEEWLTTSPTTMLVIYYTLGQHKGVNPFVRNLNSAQNFHRALQKLSLSWSSTSSASSETDASTNDSRKNWRIVLTGSDATLPSTQPPSEMILPADGNDAGAVLTVPRYKIGTNNFVYAMSKLGQYYWIANAVARLVITQIGENHKMDYEELTTETEQIFEKIRKHVTAAGEDGVYHGDSDESVNNSNVKTSISMAELDEISVKMSDRIKEGRLRDHFRISDQISICYTPLHAKPWTEDAIQSTGNSDNSQVSSLPSSSQKAFILEQIVKRLKNAISIESAAKSHFVE